MTIDTFMEKLAQTPHTWQVDTLGQLRGYYNGVRCCPIQAVAGEEQLEKAFAQLGLKDYEYTDIMITADLFDIRAYHPLHAPLAAATINRSAQ